MSERRRRHASKRSPDTPAQWPEKRSNASWRGQSYQRGEKWAPRQCRHCSAPFQPIRKDQDFCSGGACRRAWWQEHRAERPHNCRCGEEHNPQRPMPWAAATVGQLFLRYADQERLPLPSGLRAYLMGDTRPVVPVDGSRCQRGHCRGSVLTVSEGDDPRCLLCGRTAEAAREHEEPEREATLAHYG